MAKVSPLINSFNAGELSPLLSARSDLAKYPNGCARMLNMWPTVQGPAHKSPGTRHVNSVKYSDKFTRLESFIFSREQAYILEIGEGYIRFFYEGGYILDGGVPYEVVTPYTEDQLRDVEIKATRDIIYMVHGEVTPYKLSRLAHNNWTMEPVVFDWPAFEDLNATSRKLTASADTGTVTVTASTNTFAATDVGGYLMFSEILESNFDKWVSGEAKAIGDFCFYAGNLYVVTVAGTTGLRPPVHVKGVRRDGGVSWEFVNSGAGYMSIDTFVSTTEITGTVISRLTQDCLTGTNDWALSAWTDTKGYPSKIVFHEDRLVMSRWQTFTGSVSGDYENFRYGSNDDDAYSYTINDSEESNEIQWMTSSKVLSLGTTGGEFTARASSLEKPITPTNVRVFPETGHGSRNVRPVKLGNTTLFVQRSGTRVREYLYSFEVDSFVAVDLTRLANHILRSPVTDSSYHREPNRIVWWPMEDGGLVGLTYERQDDVVGFHEQDVSGDVKSVATIPHWDGDQDSTWLIVQRGDNQTVEYFEKYKTGVDAFFVNNGLTYDGAPATTISNLDHLIGEEVAILADGYVVPNQVVSATGTIELDTAASVVHVGIPMPHATIEPMKPDAGAGDGTAQGKDKRVDELVIRVLETGPGLFYGDGEIMDEWSLRGADDEMDAAVPLFSGDSPILDFPGDFDEGGKIVIQHTLPTPFTLIALMPQMVTYDR